MKVPNAKPLFGYKGNLPYFLVDDETFPLKTWLMRPYPRTLIITLTLPQKVFKFRVFQARRTTESSFGILAAKWGIFWQPVKSEVENAKKYAVATIYLYNYLCMKNNASKSPTGFIVNETNDEEFGGKFLSTMVVQVL